MSALAARGPEDHDYSAAIERLTVTPFSASSM
jgi:hypothetical protein